MIEHLVWHPHNVVKLLAHGIKQDEVEEMLDRDDYVIDVHPDYPGQIRMIGSTTGGRLLTIALDDLGEGWYRPITGWPAARRERALWEAYQ